MNHKTNLASLIEQLKNPKQIIDDLIAQKLEYSTQQESSLTVNEFDKNRENHRQELRERHKAFSKKLTQIAEIMLIARQSEQFIQETIEHIFDFTKSAMSVSPKEIDTLGIEDLEAKARHFLDTPGILLSEVETQQVEWLWEKRIPLGKITILDGDPGMGKSLLALNIAACVTTGRHMPDGTPGRQGGVILIAPEDGAEDTIKPRMEAAGGDSSQVLLLNTVFSLDMSDLPKVKIFERPFSLSRDLNDLEEEIKRKKAILVVIDPLTATLGHNINLSRDQDVREVFTPLAQLAERTSCAILIIRHLNKGSSTNPLYRGAGSIGIIAAARIGLIVARDPYDEQKSVLATIKNNLSMHASNLTYQIVESEDGTPIIQWLGENHHSASNLLRAATSKSFERQEILKVLKQAGGPLEAKEIAERTGQKYESIRMALSRMYDAGEIARPYRGKYTSLDYFSITEISMVAGNDTSVTNVTNVTNDARPTSDLS